MITRLRGMQWLMSFVGCIDVLMEKSGLLTQLECTFAGVQKTLTGKNFAMDVCALRFIVLELLRGFDDDVTSFDELSEKLDCISQENILAERWVKNLIQLIFLMTLLITVERERELPLHLYACKNAPIFLYCRVYNRKKG